MAKQRLADNRVLENDALRAIFNNKKKELSLTQDLLADKLGISQGAIYQYLKGINPLNVQIAAQFAQELKVDIDDFSQRLADEIRKMHSFVTPYNINHANQNIGNGQQNINHFLPTETQNSLKKIIMPDNAMLPTFPQGSELTIDTTQATITDGKIYQIQIGKQQIIRRLYRDLLSGSLKLVCDNPTFDDVLMETNTIQMIGRVIEWRVKD